MGIGLLLRGAVCYNYEAHSNPFRTRKTWSKIVKLPVKECTFTNSWLIASVCIMFRGKLKNRWQVYMLTSLVKLNQYF